MSMGNTSPVYAPVTAKMLPIISERFKLEEPFVHECHRILTDGLVTETLLFVALMKQVQRFRLWRRIEEKQKGRSPMRDSIEAFGPTIKLSAIRREHTSDGRPLRPGKMQTDTMVLLHDVMVELQMAQGNFSELQHFLRQHNIMFIHYHSCGKSAINPQDEQAFYKACKVEQLHRTELDWSGEHEKDVPLNRILAEAHYTAEDAAVANECFTLAFELVSTFPAVTIAAESLRQRDLRSDVVPR